MKEKLQDREGEKETRKRTVKYKEEKARIDDIRKYYILLRQFT
jgi:hypothetical protein